MGTDDSKSWARFGSALGFELALRRGRAGIDLLSLNVMEGKICWDLYIEGLVINADGNLLDALGAAIKARYPLPFDVLLTTYDIVLMDQDFLSQIRWTYAVIDEAQRLKNSSSYTLRSLRKLTRILKDGLSGNSRTVMIATVSSSDNHKATPNSNISKPPIA
ncbi:hypothetical protein Syun_029817 [Stephania yunnanensis]|uniref:SNF2 N-terminal domain-containing protein n=1 Tax=Stephania yunnanensis TaxID=152371 RepID=A0AAP0E9B1_9MAGN